MRFPLFYSTILFALLSVLLVLSTTQCGQPTDATEPKIKLIRYVIAPSGIKLRSKPDLDAQPIETIAFGSEVTLKHQPDGSPKIAQMSGNISGYFVEVTHQGKTGWVFSAYLSETCTPLKNAFHIFPQESIGTCAGPAIGPDYHYYSVYSEPSTNTTHLAEFKPEFYTIDNGKKAVNVTQNFVGQGYNGFVIVSRERFTDDGTFSNASTFYDSFGQGMPTSSQIPDAGKLALTQSSFEFDIEIGEKGIRTLWCNDLSRNKRTQLTKAPLDFGKAMVCWYGDLDRDGRQDFILGFTGTNAPVMQLFLSSQYSNQSNLEPVADYTFSSCH
jgi:Bacterial SH3 domain